MAEPKKKNVFIITIDPLKPPSLPPHGQETMDQNSLGDTESSKTIISREPLDSKNPSSTRIPRWLQTQTTKIRTSRTRQALIAFFFVVVVILLAVLLWLDNRGHLHEAFKKTNQVQLKQGTYLGEVVAQSPNVPRSIEVFRGIPYAQSTAGNNRFRPPQPINDTTSRNVQRALTFGHICPQGNGGKNQGEDCLNLNIFRPHFSDDAATAEAEMSKLGVDGNKLPVVIYVHGGGFNGGSGQERNMMTFVSWSETPLIGISFNYRVGALGFLPSAVSAKEGLLNIGLKDQQALFQWVQDNIADVGGDPKNVTIMGLSAGAHSIGHHLISYSPANKLTSAPPPFQKAILESGGSTARATFNPTHPLHEQQFKEFLTNCGLENTTDDKIFEELRALPLDKIVSASHTVFAHWNPSIRWPFQPTIDGPGGIIPDLPIKSWEKGHVLRIPIMTGYNTDEGADFVPSHASNSSALRTLMTAIVPALNKTDIETLDSLYPDPSTPRGESLYITRPPTGFGSQFWRLDDGYGHYAYICPVLQTAHFASTAADAGPVYTYHYAARSNSHGGADHGDEAPIIAHEMDVIGKYPGIVTIADSMNGFWTRFAVTGDPNSGPRRNDTVGLSWPKFISPFVNDTATANNAENVGKLALFGQGNDERMGARGRQNKGIPAQTGNVTERLLDECRFWWNNVIYSEGFGNGSTALSNVVQKTKA
ncbi:alpha/beta-hydrolase [Daldinia caldariorum]|uniref:alpha/beta-hydrolase n=1 Tax=Daldinia caldariorum TaxID=326644 RepID=UPI002007DD2F|nr:alpha/beta-hydrolase [Daldinia caldariorum]KAI1471608.1 alpha/beta-hydrolase [Daldinia caldariorum]